VGANIFEGSIMENYNLLPDQPLKSTKAAAGAKFGHKEIAETLSSLVLNCPTPFTIGLFGRWGAGKSTISYMLKDAMLKNKISFVLFDVWKHEADALRRTFLKESFKQLSEQKNIKEKYSLEDRIDSKITRQVEGEFELTGFLRKYWKIAVIISLYFLLAAFLTYYFLGEDNLKSYISIILSVFSGGGILTVIISKAMKHFLTSETITYEIDRYKDPHEFQHEFEELLSNTRTNKILVIFDNLDRVTHEKAVAILATIKTFLETENVKGKGVVFLIPCDDRAIKDHLKSVYHLSNGERDAFSEEEFLRKFFNTTLQIPDFYPTELESYAMDLLSVTKIDEIKEPSVAWLLTKAYRQNPRQIKQFINQLIGMYILVKKRIEKEMLPSDFLEGNISKLAKFLILHNKFPAQMGKLRQEKIWDIAKVTEVTIIDDKEFGEFTRFLAETSHISIDNLNIFFTLRRSEFEVQLPGYDDFATALQDNRTDEVTAYLKALSEFSKKKDVLSHVIKKLLSDTSLQETKISIINACLTALNRINERLEDEVYHEIANELSSLQQYMHVITPSIVFDQILKPYHQHREDFIRKYVSLLSDTKPLIKFVEALFVELVKNKEWCIQYISKLSEIIVEKYYDQPQIIKLLLKDEKTQHDFALGKILEKTIATLSLADLESGKPFDEKIVLVVSIVPNEFDEALIAITLNKVTEVLANENTKPFDASRLDIQKRYCKGLATLLKKHESLFLEKGGQADKDALSNAVMQAVNKVSNWEQRNIYINLLTRLSKIGTSIDAPMRDFVGQFIANTTISSLSSVFDEEEEREWDAILSDSAYEVHLKQRALRDQEVFDYLYKYLDANRKRDWLLLLFDAHPALAVQKVDALGEDVPDLENIMRKLLEISESIDVDNKAKVYDICDKFDFANNEELLKLACDNAKRYVKTYEQNIQKLGYEISTNVKSFKITNRRDIVREVIDWLISLQPTELYQQYAIRTVLYLWNTLRGQTVPQRNFIEFIFRLLLEAADGVVIELGFEALTRIRPQYKDFNAYYDDLKDRTKTEANEDLTKHFLKGFDQLRAILGSQSAWWNWVSSITEEEVESTDASQA